MEEYQSQSTLQLITSNDFVYAKSVPKWLVENYQFFLVPTIFYPIVVHSVQGKFRFDLKPALFAWNLLLCIYSGVSFVYLTPHLMNRLINHGYHETICLERVSESYIYMPYGRWIFIFILSKVFELGDTGFLLLRGKPVGLLHWYHHLITLILAFTQGIMMIETFEWATWMNTLIHTFMYAHYAITTYVPNRRGNTIITSMQIAQMFHGVFFTIYHAVNCNSFIDLPGICVYGIYSVLFIGFFSNKYKKKLLLKQE